MDFENKVALVTGGASGIGAATSRRFADEGATVVVTDIDIEGGETVAADIRDTGGDAVFAELDVSDAEAFQSVVDAVVEDYGQLDVVCNNAGVPGPKGDIDQVTEAERDRVFDVNIKGVWNGCRAAVRTMKEQDGGAIVNTASVVGFRGYTPLLPYATSKAAVLNLTRSLAGQVAPDGIRVNAICPGMVETPMNNGFLESFDNAEAVREEAKQSHAMNRIGQPEEIANCIAFLASEEASFVTGHTLVADGGYEAILD